MYDRVLGPIFYCFHFDYHFHPAPSNLPVTRRSEIS